MTRKIALSITSAQQLGTSMAAEGWTEKQLAAWCTTMGYSSTGLTRQRLLRAFRAQVARG